MHIQYTVCVYIYIYIVYLHCYCHHKDPSVWPHVLYSKLEALRFGVDATGHVQNLGSDSQQVTGGLKVQGWNDLVLGAVLPLLDSGPQIIPPLE